MFVSRLLIYTEAEQGKHSKNSVLDAVWKWGLICNKIYIYRVLVKKASLFAYIWYYTNYILKSNWPSDIRH